MQQLPYHIYPFSVHCTMYTKELKFKVYGCLANDTNHNLQRNNNSQQMNEAQQPQVRIHDTSLYMIKLGLKK